MGRHPSQAVEADVPRVEDYTASNDHDDEVNQGHTPSNETRNFVEHVVEAEIRQKRDLVEALVAGPDEVAADVAGILGAAKPDYSRGDGVTAHPNSIEAYSEDEPPVTPNTSSNNQAELNQNEAAPSNGIQQFVEQVVEADILQKQDLRETQVAGAGQVAEEVAGIAGAKADTPTDGVKTQQTSVELYLDDEPTCPNEHLVADNLHEAEDPHSQAAAPAPAPAARRPLATPGAFAVEGIGASPRPDDMSPRPDDMMEERSPSPVNPPDIEAADPNVDLVEARRVSANNPLTEAQEVNQAQLEQDKAKRRLLLHQRLFRIFATHFLVAILALAAGIGIGRATKTCPIEPTQQPTQHPSLSPTKAPTQAPTGALDLLQLNLPQDTLNNLNNISTPQWAALDWLSRHPDLLAMEEWKKTQLFALATFYFAMEGPQWRENIRKNWLQYDTDECYWFYGGTGRFNYATGQWMQEHLNATNCNEQRELLQIHLDGLELEGTKPFVPPEIALLTALTILELRESHIKVPLADFVPIQLYQMNLTLIDLSENDLYGSIPSEFSRMNKIEDLSLGDNPLTGAVPSELGLTASLTAFSCHLCNLTSSIPTELGLLTNMWSLEVWGNSLTSTIPTELGLATSLEELSLDYNELTGKIPTELFALPYLSQVWLSGNELSGPIPSELALLPSIRHLWLYNNQFSGSLPSELGQLMVNGTLEYLTLQENPLLEGTVPEGLCSLGLANASALTGISFDCSEQLCGCCWCPCPGTNVSSTNCSWSLLTAYDPSEEDEEWPGLFPIPINTPNAVTFNIHTDEWPEENKWEWSVQTASGVWETLDSSDPQGKDTLYSHTKQVESNTMYRLRIIDALGDGTCCEYGLGWFTVTNSIPSADHSTGTVIWNATGDVLESSLDVFLLVDSEGYADLEDVQHELAR